MYGEHDYEVLTSAREGLQRQEDHFGSKQRHDTDGYNIIPFGYCTYRNRSDDGKYAFNINTISEKAIVSKFYPVFRFTNANSTFMAEFLNSSPRVKKKLSVLAVGTSQVVLSFEALKAAKFDLPCKDEQDKIAAFLECLNTRIENQRTLVVALKKYKRGLSKAVFSTNSELFPKSTVASLGELFPFIRNGFVGTVTPFFTSQENGVRYLQGTNIHDGKISDETAFYVTQAFNQKHSKNILKSNDILVVQSGHVGECAVVGDNYAGSNCHALIIMNNGGECASDYICQYINSDDGKKKIAAITTGNTIKHILATSIANIEVPLPSKKDQQRIAELLNSWDNRIEQEIRNLCKLVRIKEGLLQQLFI